MTNINKSPQVDRLDIFIGQWKNAGQVIPGPFGPGGEISGSTSYYWGVQGKWLQYISRLELPGIGKYEVQGGIAYNTQSEKYDAYAVNNMGALLVYEGEWVDETNLVFILLHPTPAGTGRICYEILPKKSIRMRSDSLAENGDFETYFKTLMVPAPELL